MRESGYFAGGVDTILLVEDDSAVRQILHRLLNGAGYVIIATGDPDYACDLLNDCVIHALILDVRLPKNRSGLEVLARARALCRTANLPAIVLTGSELSFDEERTISDYDAHLFRKPANIQELIQFLDAHIKKRPH